MMWLTWRAKAVDDVAQQVVRHGPRRRGLAQLHGDGLGFGRADPDNQIVFALLLFEDQDAVQVLHAYPDGFDAHFNHCHPPPANLTTKPVYAWPLLGVNANQTALVTV